jgi:hypothetical protein
MIALETLSRDGLATAQAVLADHHYLHRPVDPRCSVEGYEIRLTNYGFAGYLLFGRPEATRCGDWYGSVEDVQAGRCEVTRWQVLNLARVWLAPEFQPGGAHWEYWGKHRSYYIPGFVDRKGVFRSTLASDVLRLAISRVGCDYLMRRPPCFLEEPYEIRWLLSYCDTRLHKGTIYQASGFELYRTNKAGIQTWRIRLPGLTPEQVRAVREASRVNPRAQGYRAKRAQTSLDLSP